VVNKDESNKRIEFA